MKINLQLFAGEPDEENDKRGKNLPDELFNDWDDEDNEPKDPDEDDGNNGDEDNLDNDDEGGEEPEVAEPDKSKGKTDQDAIYAKLRRKAEAEAAERLKHEKEELAAERLKIEQERRINSISQEQIWDKADEEGVSEEAARKMLQLEERARIVEEREANLKRQSDLEQQKKKLRGELYFKELEVEIDKFVEQYPDTNVEGAFHYLRSTKLPDLMAGKIKATEKRTIADMHDRARRGGVSGGSDAGHTEDINPRTILSRADLEMCEAFGTDPKVIARKVKEHQKAKRKG